MNVFFVATAVTIGVALLLKYKSAQYSSTGAIQSVDITDQRRQSVSAKLMLPRCSNSEYDFRLSERGSTATTKGVTSKRTHGDSEDLSTKSSDEVTAAMYSEREAKESGEKTPKDETSTEDVSSNEAYGTHSKSEDDAQVLNDASMLASEKKNAETKRMDFLRRVEMYTRNREARIRACRTSMDKTAKEARKFQAKPAPKFHLTKKIANSRTKTTRPQPFQLRTAERAEQRKQFENKLKQKQEAIERLLADKRRRAEELEAKEIREIRKRTVIRAQPILCELPPRRQKKGADMPHTPLSPNNFHRE
ncbi:TPX2 domain containing protein [Trichuris trichiura]|uniref:TPX2 domain containing protein n=1 Tax=Trichuris trichiura TaxID=36087 RepID=A0A077YZ65_TRITR|nr:TPX2 domain containing protein [Trichuris trichiura]